LRTHSTERAAGLGAGREGASVRCHTNCTRQAQGTVFLTPAFRPGKRYRVQLAVASKPGERGARHAPRGIFEVVRVGGDKAQRMTQVACATLSGWCRSAFASTWRPPISAPRDTRSRTCMPVCTGRAARAPPRARRASTRAALCRCCSCTRGSRVAARADKDSPTCVEAVRAGRKARRR
jgi:hypothetical protein